jgi:hypothetical protein
MNDTRTFVCSPLFLGLGPLAHVRAISLCLGPFLEHPHKSVREMNAGAKERKRLCAIFVHAEAIEGSVKDLAIVNELLLE